eukprot:g2821.t1
MTNISPVSAWFLGVFLYISGTFCLALGANLQRYSILSEFKKPEGQQRPKSKQPLWIFGVVFYVSCGFMLSAALEFATQAQLAPLLLCIFVFNCALATLMNNEPFECATDGICIGVVCVGLIITIIVAPKENTDYTSDQMIELYKQPSFVCFIVILALFILLMFFTKYSLTREVDGDLSRIENSFDLMLLNLSFGGLAGSFGGLNITLTKSVLSLITGEYEKGGFSHVFSSALLWILGLLLISTYVIQMKFTTDGLEACSATTIVSCQAVTEEIVATMGGLLYFQDYVQFTLSTGFLFMIGNLLAIGAVVTMTWIRLSKDAERNYKSFDPYDQRYTHNRGPSMLRSDEFERKRTLSRFNNDSAMGSYNFDEAYDEDEVHDEIRQDLAALIFCLYTYSNYL